VANAPNIRGKEQRHNLAARAVGHGDLRLFGGVVEDAVGVVVDPAGERRRAAGVVGHDHVDGRLRADGQRQIGQRMVQPVLVIRQRAIHIIRIGRRVLQRTVVCVDTVAEEQRGLRHVDDMARPGVGGQRLVVARACYRAQVGGIAKIRGQQAAVFERFKTPAAVERAAEALVAAAVLRCAAFHPAIPVMMVR
jgi:hypothetical protein